MIYLQAAVALSVLGGVIAVLLQVAERFLADYGPCNVTVNDDEPFVVEGGCTVLDGLYRRKIFIPSACGGQATCGFCKVVIAEGGGPVLPTELPYLGEDELAAGVRLACQVKIKQDLTVRIRPEWLNVAEFKAVVAAAESLTHDTRGIVLELREPAAIEFTPGQYVQVLVPGMGEPTYRAYSISSTPGEPGKVSLIVRHIPGGLCSTYLHRVRVGDEVIFTGPYGDFVMDADPSVGLVCVAGGCGVAPILSIVRYLWESSPERRCRVFLGFRTEDDIVCADELRELSEAMAGLDVHVALSEAGPSSGRRGETGFVHECVAAHLEAGGGRQAFLCGPPPMIQATMTVLMEKGVEREKVFYDEF